MATCKICDQLFMFHELHVIYGQPICVECIARIVSYYESQASLHKVREALDKKTPESRASDSSFGNSSSGVLKKPLGIKKRED